MENTKIYKQSTIQAIKDKSKSSKLKYTFNGNQTLIHLILKRF